MTNDDVIVDETNCAICGKHVDRGTWHLRFTIRNPRGQTLPRLGVLHNACIPPQGVDEWLDSQSRTPAVRR